MVDSAINCFFVDLNSYFASIEQELEEFDDTADKLRTPRGPRGIRASDLPRVQRKTLTSGGSV